MLGLGGLGLGLGQWSQSLLDVDASKFVIVYNGQFLTLIDTEDVASHLRSSWFSVAGQRRKWTLLLGGERCDWKIWKVDTGGKTKYLDIPCSVCKDKNRSMLTMTSLSFVLYYLFPILCLYLILVWLFLSLCLCICLFFLSLSRSIILLLSLHSFSWHFYLHIFCSQPDPTGGRHT